MSLRQERLGVLTVALTIVALGAGLLLTGPSAWQRPPADRIPLEPYASIDTAESADGSRRRLPSSKPCPQIVEPRAPHPAAVTLLDGHHGTT
jgi:hypothetical protein